ncbi:MAG: hypothetical protein ACOZQL_10860 [Myxococcota bacterium]
MSEREAVARWLARCEESYRRAQRGTCPVRYRAAREALAEAERVAQLVLAHEEAPRSN